MYIMFVRFCTVHVLVQYPWAKWQHAVLLLAFFPVACDGLALGTLGPPMRAALAVPRAAVRACTPTVEQRFRLALINYEFQLGEEGNRVSPTITLGLFKHRFHRYMQGTENFEAFTLDEKLDACLGLMRKIREKYERGADHYGIDKRLPLRDLANAVSVEAYLAGCFKRSDLSEDEKRIAYARIADAKRASAMKNPTSYAAPAFKTVIVELGGVDTGGCTCRSAKPTSWSRGGVDTGGCTCRSTRGVGATRGRPEGGRPPARRFWGATSPPHAYTVGA